jgi:DNA-binding transcriptional regulator LsrR (DeoR family)
MTDLEMERLLSKIARLYYLEDMNQDQIADKFNINRVRVSRYLKRAREKDLVEIKVKTPPESYQALEREIETVYGLKECIVVSGSEPADVLRGMASALSGVLERVLRDGDFVGVNYGITLKGISPYLNSVKREGIKVVPIVGGIGRIETGIHTNVIAKNFADALGGISYVINAPAILDSKEAKDILMRDSNAREIFDLIRKLSVVVFSFSDIGPDCNYTKFGFLSDEDLEYLRGLGTVGDVNLDFIDAEGEHIPNRVFDRVITAPIADLKNVKNVIGVAYGKRKRDISRAVLKGRVVKVLIVDKSLADSLVGADSDGSS